MALGVSIATFFVSLVFIISGFAKGLKPNIITGNVIGPSQLASYSIIVLVVSFIVGMIIVMSMRK